MAVHDTVYAQEQIIRQHFSFVEKRQRHTRCGDTRVALERQKEKKNSRIERKGGESVKCGVKFVAGKPLNMTDCS